MMLGYDFQAFQYAFSSNLGKSKSVAASEGIKYWHILRLSVKKAVNNLMYG